MTKRRSRTILGGVMAACLPSLVGAQEPLVERFRIGSVNGLGPDAFERVIAAAVSGDGRLYVADSQSRRITVWSLEGEHLGGFGRAGEGPGEFGFPLAGVAVVDSTVVVVDQSTVHRFDRNGSYVTRAPAATVTRVSLLVEVSAGGASVAVFTREAEGGRQYWRAYPVGADAALGDVLAEWQHEPLALSARGDQVWWANSRFGVVASIPGGYALDVGNSGRSVSLDPARSLLTRASFERQMEMQRERCEGYGVQTAECLRALDAAFDEAEGRIGNPAPAVGRLVAAGDGRVAVARVDLSDDPFTSFTDHIEVVDLVSGSSRMHRLPEEVDLLAVRGEWIVGRVPDAFEVDFVVGFAPAR